MTSNLLKKLENKSITKENLTKAIEKDFGLLPEIVDGMNSSKAAVRYGCGKVLMDLSKEYPEKLYPYMDSFIDFLGSKYRIITWQAMAIIANLTQVDKNKKFDANFDRYYSLIDDEYMVTVANVVGHSGKIALAKPQLIPKITKKLLLVENIKTTPHLTQECKRVIAEAAIGSFDMFFDKIDQKESVLAFVKKYDDSARKSLRAKAQEFIKKWG